jgi:GNAT superfamily N-acetyltransferase
MTRIVGVHGVGNYLGDLTDDEAAARLSAVWSRACRHGESTLDLSVAYYASVLRSRGRQGGGDGVDDLTEDAADMVRAWLANFDLPDGVGQGVGTWPLRQALGWLAQRRRLPPRLVERFVATFFGEVAVYLNPSDSDCRHRAREAVARTIRRHEPTVILGHSLGSVVAYETLWSYPEIKVDVLVTLGSPLALPQAVFPRLRPAPRDGRGARPPGVSRWVNIADPGDLVALPPKGVSQRFAGVASDDHDVIGVFSFHSATKYLATQCLSAILQDCP